MKPILSIRFFAGELGKEPVREWLKNDLSAQDRKIIGEDIKTVQFGWPIGMPLVDHIVVPERKLGFFRESEADQLRMR